MLESAKHRNKCESPQVMKPPEASLTQRENKPDALLRHQTSFKLMEKQSQQQISLTARKNLTHHKMTPLVSKTAANPHHE